MGDNLEDDEPVPQPPSLDGATATPARKRLKTGKTGKAPENEAGAVATFVSCLVCEDQRYASTRFCYNHKQNVDSMYYQALHPQPPTEPYPHEFKADMKDDDFAAHAVTEWQKSNPALKKRGKKALNWAELKKGFGVRNSRRFVATEEPEEEAEYVGKLKAKGYSAKDAAAAWKEKLVTCEVADYKGLKGSVRLWVEQKPKRTREKELFGETSATQGSDRMKDPKDEVIDAMRSFCHTIQKTR